MTWNWIWADTDLYLILMKTNAEKQCKNTNLVTTHPREINKILMTIKKIFIRCMKRNMSKATYILVEVISIFLF